MHQLHIDLTPLLDLCQRELLDASPIAITYEDRVSLERNALPPTLGTSPVNIYALWATTQQSDAWQLMYIGQRSTKEGWGRVRQHLFSTPKGTQSKLAQVRAALHSGAKIGVTAILVEPDSMRLAVEEELIRRNSCNEGSLPWNQKARAKKVRRARA